MTTQQEAQLVRMANQIALNLGAEHYPDRAATRLADHLRRFWTPAMCARLQAYQREGGDDLNPVVVRVLEEMSGEATA